MRKTAFARSGGLILAAVLIAANLSGSAQASPDTGSIQGTFVDRSGLPMAGVVVKTETLTGTPVDGQATTDASGHYIVAEVGAGTHRVRFEPPGYQGQYAYQQSSAISAAAISVTAGNASIVDDQLMPFGTVIGRLTARDGSGLPNVQVRHGRGQPAIATTDADGYFTAHKHPGTYIFVFELPDSVPAAERISQYIPQTDNATLATRFTVTEGQTTTVSDTVMPNGYLTGTFTNEVGSPVVGVYVQVTSPSSARIYSTLTDANGNWRRRVVAGTQVVEFSENSPFNIHQFAYSQVLRADATPITVLDGQTVTVNDSKLREGSAKVVVRDAVSGRLVRDFEAWIDGHTGVPQPQTELGTQVITNLAVGRHYVSVRAYGYRTVSQTQQVKVESGAQTTVEVLLQPRARIEATAVDAKTGQPVAGVCINAGTTESFVMNQEAACYQSGTDGWTMTEVPDDAAATYQVLAMPVGAAAKGYGAQWVGPSSGKGSQPEAQNISVGVGQAVAAPVIKLDHAGTIAGRVSVTGGGFVSPANFSYSNVGVAEISGTGEYAIDFLGPYSWPLRFWNVYEAAQYSGGTTNRLQAQRIQVTAGATAAYNFQFQPNIYVTVVLPRTGEQCSVDAVDATTGDVISAGYQLSTGRCVDQPVWLRVVPGQAFKLLFHHQNTAIWYGELTFASTSAFRIDSPQTIVFALTHSPRVDEPGPGPDPEPVPRPTSTPPSLPPVPRV